MGTKRDSSVLMTEVIHCGIYRSGKVDVLYSLGGAGGVVTVCPYSAIIVKFSYFVV